MPTFTLAPRGARLAALLLLTTLLSGCGINNIPTYDEQVKAACAASGTSGICGFPAISGCQCVQGRCEARRDGFLREGAPRQ